MAVLQQERHVELVSGTQERFVITSRMASASIPSELPHLNVFVLTIADRSNPKADTLARVARLSDISTLPIGRDAGLASGSGTGLEYLVSSAVASYTNLTDGVNGAAAIKDRVNALITDWSTFRSQFNAPDPTPASYTLPATDSSAVTTLIAAYKAAKQDRYQKQIDKTSADAALTAAQADYTYKTQLASDISAASGQGTANVSEMTAAKGFLSDLKAAGDTFLGAASCASTGDKNTFQDALNAAANEDIIVGGYVTDAGSLYTTLNTYQAARNTDKTNASVTLTAATADQVTKAQLLTSALATEASTLAALLAVCPDFDPHSIPYVDG